MDKELSIDKTKALVSKVENWEPSSGGLKGSVNDVDVEVSYKPGSRLRWSKTKVTVSREGRNIAHHDDMFNGREHDEKVGDCYKIAESSYTKKVREQRKADVRKVGRILRELT